jgi:hypothetical protein
VAVNCPNCENEVRDGAPYCDLCHSLLEQSGRSGLPGGPGRPLLTPVSPISLRGTRAESEEGGGEVPLAQPHPSRAVYAPPNVTGYTQKPPQAYGQPLARPVIDSYQQRMLIATVVLAVAGVLVFCCTFMPWMGLDMGLGIKLDISGWQIFREIGGSGGNPFYLRLRGISVFTGLCSLLGGILMAGFAGALLIWRRRELVYAIFPVTLLMLGISLINTINIAKIGFGLGSGTIIFLAASIAGIAAGVFIRQNLPA